MVAAVGFTTNKLLLPALICADEKPVPAVRFAILVPE
jgi:hypothetical protein